MPAPATVFVNFIPFECPCCGRVLRVAAEFAGELVRCPVCRAMANVPGTVKEAVVSPDDPTTPLRPNTKPVRQ